MSDNFSPDFSSALPPMPDFFRAAIADLHNANIRPEISLEKISPPTRLAPYSYALSAAVYTSGRKSMQEEDALAFGRIIFLYDPQGKESWEGSLRVVIYIESELDDAMAHDPLLPQVGWSWLHDALNNNTDYSTLGGTVTSTASYRYGDIAGPEHTNNIELRASWTAKDNQLHKHLLAYCTLLENTAGLPPQGIIPLDTHISH